jgi:hypothetical protein
MAMQISLGEYQFEVAIGQSAIAITHQHFSCWWLVGLIQAAPAGPRGGTVLYHAKLCQKNLVLCRRNHSQYPCFTLTLFLSFIQSFG